MNLSDFLLEGARTPWRDGVHDCSAWPARWAGIGIPADYATHGKPLSEVWADWIGDRMVRVDDPMQGDIGVVRVVTPNGIDEIGGICTGPKWAMLTGKGLALCRIPTDNIVAVWRHG